MSKNLKIGCLLIAVSGMLACKTTHVVKMDKVRGELELYSNDDLATSMTDPHKSNTLKKLSDELRDKLNVPNPGIKTMLDLAQVQLIRGELDLSEKILRRVLRRDLKNKNAKLLLAKIFYRRGLFNMSNIILAGLGGSESKNSEVLNLLALISLEKNENSLAMAYFKGALKRNPGDIAVRMNLGVLYLEYDQLKEAAIQFERVISMVPNHSDAKLHLAVVWANRGKQKEAEKVYQEILDDKDNNPVALYNYAVLQSEMHEYDDAMDTLKTYIGLARSKSSKTDKAFALIDVVQREMQGTSERMSADEIEALVGILDKNDKKNIKLQNARRPRIRVPGKTQEERQKIARQISSEVSSRNGVVKKTSAKKVLKVRKAREGGQQKASQNRRNASGIQSDNIDDLEKMLLE